MHPRPCSALFVQFLHVFSLLCVATQIPAVCARPSGASGDPVAHLLFPARDDRPCPCVTAGKDRRDAIAADRQLRNTTSLGDTLLSPDYMRQHHVCQDMFSMFPYSWIQAPMSFNITTSVSAVLRAKSLVWQMTARCKDTCAVVGGSLRLRGAGHGPEIDRADVVIRVNAAPVIGFEGDVGKKTTLRLVFPRSLSAYLEKKSPTGRVSFREDESAPVLYVMRCDSSRCNALMRLLSTSGRPGLKVRQEKHLPDYPQGVVDRLVRVDMKKFYQIFKAFSHRKLSSGGLAITLSLMLCRNVTMYGFGDESSPLYGYYYQDYGNASQPAVVDATHTPHDVRHHDIYDEWRAWKALSDAGLITAVH
eukprot:jgi/Mesvir1/22421/Mv17898-RA.1